MSQVLPQNLRVSCSLKLSLCFREFLLGSVISEWIYLKVRKGDALMTVIWECPWSPNHPRSLMAPLRRSYRPISRNLNFTRPIIAAVTNTIIIITIIRGILVKLVIRISSGHQKIKTISFVKYATFAWFLLCNNILWLKNWFGNLIPHLVNILWLVFCNSPSRGDTEKIYSAFGQWKWSFCTDKV